MRLRVHPGLLAALAVYWIGAAVGAGGVSREYQIKAAFLYNFTKFVEWPAGSFASANSDIVLGVSCANALDADLESVVRGRKVNGRALAVRKVASVEDLNGVHVLFTCAEQDQQFALLRSKVVSRRPVLTVGETGDFGRMGGMIIFVLDGDKVRFEINADATDRAGLKVSAQLQKLATSIRKSP